MNKKNTSSTLESHTKETPPYKNTFEPQSTLEKTIYHFFELSEKEVKNGGGFWVSKDGGTANVMAGELTKIFKKTSFHATLTALNKIGGREWYIWLYKLNHTAGKTGNFSCVVEELLHQAYEDVNK